MKPKKSENTEEKDSPNELLQPEILSKETLVSIFKQRKVEVADIDSLDHATLVDLFYKNVIPLPQRKYRHNRRGQTATKQQITASKHKRSYDDMKGISYSVDKTSQKNQPENSRFLCSYNIPSKGDRLKPPPSAINPDRKIIRLKSSSSTVVNVPDKKPATKPQTTLATTSKVGAEKASVKIPPSEETLTKTLPNKYTPKKPRTKIKLNRNSLSVSSPEISPPTVPDTEQPVLEEEKTGKGDAPEKASSNGKESHEESSEEAVVRKKFKAVSVKWP